MNMININHTSCILIFLPPCFYYHLILYKKEKDPISRAGNECDSETVRESVGVVERERRAIRQRLPVVDETVIIVNTLENPRVNQLNGAEPTAADVDPRDVASRHALVRDLHGVTGYSVGHRFGRCLVHHNV